MTEDELKQMLNRGESLNKAYATLQLIDSVMSGLRGQRNISEIVLSRTCLVPNVDFFSLPVILGPRGIAHRFPLPSLTERESILLDHAVKHIEIDKMKGVNILRGECCVPKQPEMTEKYSELITDDCRKDFVRSLIEKFKIGVECPEVCQPRVEYKLLSKVKLKLPPEATPSKMPKRTKFIEPDTLDGCCPLKLPCTPIPPLRGLNQIQAKHTCKSIDKPKACKCFFPPVEKSLAPCKLCPSNKPCADYGDFKTFYEEHSCGPASTCREVTSCSDSALISEGTAAKHNPTATQENCSVQPTSSSESNQPDATKGLPMKLPSQVADAGNPKKIIFQAVGEYPRTDLEENPGQKHVQPTLLDVKQPTHTNLINSPDKELSAHIQTTNSHSQPSVMKKSDTTAATPPQHFNVPLESSNKNDTNTRGSIQSGTVQHDDPNWPFKCSTSLCLDVLAPKKSSQTTQETSYDLRDCESNLASDQKHTELQNSGHASMQNPPSAPPMAQNMKANDQQEQRKMHQYSSGLSFTKAQETVERISKNPPGREEIRSLANGGSNHSGNHESSINTTTAQSSAGIQDGSLPNSSSLSNVPTDERYINIESNSNDLQECSNQSKFSTQNPPSQDSSPSATTNLLDPQSTPPVEQKNANNQHKRYNYSSGLSLINSQKAIKRSELKAESDSVTIKSSTPSDEFVDMKPTDIKDISQEKDETIKRRLYASLKVIEDTSFAPKPSTSITSKSTGLSQHFYDESMNSSGSKRVSKNERPEGNTMLSILRERAKAINVNMELQRDLRACLDRSRQKKRKDIGLGDFIDTINPAKRLPKRLESRPALRETFRGLRKTYQNPKYLGNRGKSAGILVTPKPSHKEKSLIVVEESEEPRKLTNRMDRLKGRIQEALKKIIYPAELPPETKQLGLSKLQLSQKLVARPAVKKSSKAKQDFFVQMRKTDPAYRPTTRIYAPKCPTRLLYDDDPRNHSKMITFNNVIEREKLGASAAKENQKESFIKDKNTLKYAESNNKGFSFPDVPNFPELILKDTKPRSISREVSNEVAVHSKDNVTPQSMYKDDVNELHSQSLQETRFPLPVQLRGDYVKHFETQMLPKDLTLPESAIAAIKRRSRNVATPGSVRAPKVNDMRYGMTSPNRMKYSRKRKYNEMNK